MSCSSLRNRFEQLKTQGTLDFSTAMDLFLDVKGSLDAHRLELKDIQPQGDQNRIHHLEDHIKDGEMMLNELRHMTLH